MLTCHTVLEPSSHTHIWPSFYICAILLKERQAVDFKPPFIISSSRHIFFLRPSKVSGKCPSTESKLHQVISLPALITCAGFSATAKRESLQNPTPRSIPNMENFRHEARHALPAWFHGFQTSQNKTKDQEEPKVLRPLMDFTRQVAVALGFFECSQTACFWKKWASLRRVEECYNLKVESCPHLSPFAGDDGCFAFGLGGVNLTDIWTLQTCSPVFKIHISHHHQKGLENADKGGTWLRHCDKSGWSTLLSFPEILQSHQACNQSTK